MFHLQDLLANQKLVRIGLCEKCPCARAGRPSLGPHESVRLMCSEGVMLGIVFPHFRSAIAMHVKF